MKGDHEGDPTGLIYEAYRIEGITGPDCRTIFFDWAMGVPAGRDQRALVESLIAHYAPDHPDHPMTEVLREGLETPPPRRRGARRTRTD
ncbi:hypothetical protein [Oceanibium sediminis]|uniref:hypothetical protein n=1 Tax=Oceanibium sediminis TaxID=2026339 RepID=UPI000DD2EBFA|nr:hypothetical protein [Oceanibium sediminis]